MSKILLAFSGGPDSVYLAQYCKDKQIDIELYHYIHLMDEESEARAEQAIVIANYLELPIHFGKATFNIKNEAEAREYRYSAIFDFMKANNFDILYTAHHLNDQLETILMRLSKGSGLFGLKGIEIESEREDIKIVRPLLEHDILKCQILSYLDLHRIPYILDPTNQDNTILRNLYRNVIIPDLNSEFPDMHQYWINISASIVKTEIKLRRYFFSEPKIISFELFKKTNAETRGLLLDLLFRVYGERVVSLKDMKAQIERSLEAKNFKVTGPKNWILTREANKLFLVKKESSL